MLASRFVGTSERSMSSMCATQALSEVSLRSSTEAKVLLLLHATRCAYPIRGGERIQDAAKVSGIRRRDDRYTSSRRSSDDQLSELRKTEVQLLRIPLPRTSVNRPPLAP